MDFNCPEIKKANHHKAANRWDFTAPDGITCMIAEEVIDMALDPKKLVIDTLSAYRGRLKAYREYREDDD